MNLRDKKVWNGTYKGVGFEIQNFENDFMKRYGMDSWCYYLYVHVDRLPDEHKNRFWIRGKKDKKPSGDRVYYNYYKNLADYFDLGITWYSKENGFDASQKVVKIGWDCQHLWDTERNHPYDLDDIIQKTKNEINKFINYIPKYKLWCCGNGKLYFLEDGEYNEETGNFLSNEYKKEKEDKK